MISLLRGTPEGSDDDGSITITTHGVGYQVFAPDPDREYMHGKESVQLWIRTIVKESSAELYGFLDRLDRRAFDRLLKVKGLGPSTAMKILSVIDCHDLKTAVADLKCNNQSTFVTELKRVPGVGPKTLEALKAVKL